MKIPKQFAIKSLKRYTFFLGILLSLVACNNNSTKNKTEPKQDKKEEVAKQNVLLWQLNVILSDGKKLKVKAIDAEGNMYDVNAIQDSDQDSFLDIEAFVKDKKLPVKILVSKDKFAPIKAIDKGGISYDIKAVTAEGEKLDIKGIHRYGNLVSIKAITKDGKFLTVKAISPSGELNDVDGIKINHKEKEMTLNGFNVFAHIKAMHESDNDYEAITKKHQVKKSTKKSKSKKKTKVKSDFKNIIWNIKVTTLDGKKLDVKAIDEDGNQYDIKAIQDSYQDSFLNIKAIVNNSELPIKVLVNDDKFAPVKAISRDGMIYNIKAIADDGSLIDVKGVKRLGNIIDLKAVTSSGDFYEINAISPKGKLNDVIGIKIFDRPIEMSLRGNKVYAHVKALTQ